MTNNVRLGFRLHTGWAVLVAAAVDHPQRVVHRCRIEMLPAGHRRFVYHEAANRELEAARRLIEEVRATAEKGALSALRLAIDKWNVLGACIPTGGTALPDDLAAVLRSHARIHAAEGALYARAIAAACEELGIPVLTVRERGVWERAVLSTGTAEAELRERIDAIRKVVGAPWTADHKLAMAAALISA